MYNSNLGFNLKIACDKKNKKALKYNGNVSLYIHNLKLVFSARSKFTNIVKIKLLRKMYLAYRIYPVSILSAWMGIGCATNEIL